MTTQFLLVGFGVLIFELRVGTYIYLARPVCNTTVKFIKSLTKNVKVEFASFLFFCEFCDMVRDFKNWVQTTL